MDSTITSGKMIAFLFDSGKIENAWYGNVVFSAVFQGKEVTLNPRKIIVSVGDVVDQQIYNGIKPFLIRNELCTVPEGNGKYRDYIYSVVLEDIDAEIAKSLMLA